MKTEKNDCREPLSGKHIKIILFLILGVLCIGRIINANTFSPEYDELWSLRNYVTLPVAEIFRDVATPNNHTLNTLYYSYPISWILTAIVHVISLIFVFKKVKIDIKEVELANSFQ